MMLCSAFTMMLAAWSKRTSREEFQKRTVALTFFSGESNVTSGIPEAVPLPSVLGELLAQPTVESIASRSSRTVRPLASIAETQPQLQSALLRLSAMTSQDFTRADSATFALHKTMIFSRCVSQSSHLN